MLLLFIEPNKGKNMRDKKLKLMIATKEVNNILKGRKVSELNNNEKFILKAYLETMNFIYNKG